MIVDCIADLHGHYPKLEGGDLLIIAGDLTSHDLPEEYFDFEDWLEAQPYKKKIVIAGNHDNYLLENGDYMFAGSDYLCDSGTEFEGLIIWGSPWTKTFEGMNPHCKAFTCDSDEELKEKWDLIPDDIDVLITHSPPHGILDKTIDGRNAGSSTLMDEITNPFRKYLQLHVFGHIHEAYGKSKTGKWINASHVNECYKPMNKPIRVMFCESTG